MSDSLPLIPTIPNAVARAARLHADAVAIEEDGVSIGYGALHEAARGAARALMSLGVAPGERVAVWAPNLNEWIVAALGIQMAGGVLVPLNTRLKGGEAADILARSGARALISIGEFLGVDYPGMLRGHALPALRHHVILRGERDGALSWDTFLAHAEDTPETMLDACIAALTPDSPSDLLYTSGTTGRPKGVITTHGQNVRAFSDWSDIVGLRAGDRYLIINPFFHAFGYKAGWLASLLRGATILPLAQFDAETVLVRVERYRVSFLPGSPTLYLSLLDHPRLDDYDLSSLRVAVTGAASIAPELIRRMRKVLRFDVVLTAYGLTECCGLATVCRLGDALQTIANTSGRPLAGVEIRCVDAEGNDVAAGEPGEVWIRGYNVMRGYFDDEAATREAIDSGGWLHTGDIGSLDAGGNLCITGRLKDMFIVGGFNCYPAEIEHLIGAHPAVGQVAVVGTPDARLGEVGRAYVVLREGASINAEDLLEWCRPRMANYKVPRSVTFMAALPINAAGKVVKHELMAP
ncbi:FadD3 family acyl-CoA ligase [Cupriavidus necator]|uniref:FadD3 family acyl-CoA ligase n=1 Tax=Cupriavidus necator TaxID=106590 RepID=UPI0005B359B5|nr:FadD3 family acyl-CoA ligase [Cupriavidus necator]